MKKQGSLGIIVFLFALILGAIAGCGSSEDPAPAVEGVSLEDMAKMLPRTVGHFISIDFRQLREDSDLAVHYDDLGEDKYTTGVVKKATGIDACDVYWCTEAFGLEGFLTICGAEFELSAVRDRLSVELRQDDYQGVEVWRDSDVSVAIMERTIILGMADYVDQCIETIGGGRSSLYDEPDVAEVLSKVSAGFIWGGAGTGASRPGLEASAYSISKASRDTVEWLGIMAFKDGEYAELAADDINSSYEYPPVGQVTPTGYDLEQQGRFIELRMDMDIADLTG